MLVILKSIRYICFKFKTMSSFLKYTGLFLTAAGIPTLLLDSSSNSEIPLLAGLFILFVSKEKRQDERAEIIKASSAYLALIFGYGLKMISSNLYSHAIIPVHLVEINHFLILVLALAIIIYYTRMYLILK